MLPVLSITSADSLLTQYMNRDKLVSVEKQKAKEWLNVLHAIYCHILYKWLFLNHKKLQLGTLNSKSLAFKNRETVKLARYISKYLEIRETNRKLLKWSYSNCTENKLEKNSMFL